MARLILAGSPAGSRVAAFLKTTTGGPSRSAALRVLGAIGGPAAVDAAAGVLRDADPQVVADACAILGTAAGTNHPESTRALDALAGVALTPDAPIAVRQAAVSALSHLPARFVTPLHDALAQDPSFLSTSRTAPARSLAALMEGGLATDPEVVRTLLRTEGDRAALSLLQRAIGAVAAREAAATDTRPAWMALRADLHETLARRGSRLGLTDLRDTIDNWRGPLPVGFLAAAAAIGDATCLGGLARAWGRTDAADRWYREHLADVFGAIIGRLSMPRDHPVLKKILTEQPTAAALVALAPRPGSKRRTRR